MDKQTIINQIRAFNQACKDKGHTLSFCALVPEMEHYEHTSYTLQVFASWAQGMPCSDVFDILVPLLFESTTVEVREKIYRMDIYDRNGDLHCQFEDLIIENEINYNPLTAYQFSRQ